MRPTNEKDAQVLAAALGSGALYLLTLDRRHLLTRAVQSADLPVVVLSREFLRDIVAGGLAVDDSSGTIRPMAVRGVFSSAATGPLLCGSKGHCGCSDHGASRLRPSMHAPIGVGDW